MPSPLRDLEALARRHARRPEEAEDLLQDALLAAVQAGRTDLSSPETRRWLSGVLRNQGRMSARTAARRRRRESDWADAELAGEAPVSPTMDAPPEAVNPALDSLSPALKVTALLVLNGCTRAEIGWLLGLTDTTLRQRISQLRKALAAFDFEPHLSIPSSGGLPYGRLRQRLLLAARRGQALASHDPDGHLFLVTPSQTRGPRQQTGG